jgi:signal peptidase
VLSSVIGDGRSRTRSRTRSRSETLDVRTVTIALLVIVLLPTNVAMVVPSGVHEMSVDGDTVVQAPDSEAGDPVGWDYEIANRGFVPVVVVFESTDPDVSVPQYRRMLAPGNSRTISIAVEAPPPGQRRTGTVREYHYLLVLPPSTIEWLHDRHPFIAWAVLNLVVAAPFVAVLRRVGANGRIRRSTNPLVARLRRRLR